VDRAAKQLGVSRSEFFARAAERWLAALEDDQTTAAITSALAGRQHDTAFTDAAADAVARSSLVERLCGGPAPDLDEIRGIRHSTRHPGPPLPSLGSLP
jgi:hypothetical protein